MQFKCHMVMNTQHFWKNKNDKVLIDLKQIKTTMDNFKIYICANKPPDIFSRRLTKIFHDLEEGKINWNDVNEKDIKTIINSGIYNRYKVKYYPIEFVP